MFADDILWVDEDGHELNTKMFCVNFIRRQITATPKRRMTVSGIATGACWVIPGGLPLPMRSMMASTRLEWS
jgi:hypothetical protein